VPLDLPQTTVLPTMTEGQARALFAIAIVALPAGQKLSLLAGPAGSLIAVRPDGRRWKIEADGERVIESLGEIEHGC
jgi:hypothetical protein